MVCSSIAEKVADCRGAESIGCRADREKITIKGCGLEVSQKLNEILIQVILQNIFLQVPLRKELAKLYCQSLTCYLSTEEINVSCTLLHV